MSLKIAFSLTLVSVIFTSSCGSDNRTASNTENNTDTSKATFQNGCFQHLDGTKNQDTTFLTLHINGEEVKGELQHLPFEKDARKGSLEGRKDGNLVKATWRYMQEGMVDTQAVEFKLSGDRIFQKTVGVDPSTGRQILTDTSTFSIPFKKIDCLH